MSGLQPDQWKSTIEDAVKALDGKLDVLINNAGSDPDAACATKIECMPASSHDLSGSLVGFELRRQYVAVSLVHLYITCTLPTLLSSPGLHQWHD